MNDHQEVMSTQPKNYYQEFMSVKESFLSNSVYGGVGVNKRRNSFDHERGEISGFEPHILQFSTPMKGEEHSDYMVGSAVGSHQQKKSRSRSTTKRDSHEHTNK